MLALIYKGDKTINLEQIPMPTIQNPKDAVVKVELSSICSSDLHIKNGAVTRAKSDIVLGHEFVGEIVDVGNSIKNLKIGDRVVANCITFCGECYFCKQGYINNCEIGGWELGCRIDGCQAEYVRVPFAHTSLTKIPKDVSYEQALFVGDVLSSGYFGAELCEIKPADIVAVIGAGAVGLCAMMCAKLFGASAVIAIDILDQRLDVAVKNNVADIVLNPLKHDITSETMKLTNNRGVDAVVEAAGGKDTFQMAWEIARANSVVSLVAMYETVQELPLNRMYGKNLIFKTGGVDAIHCEKLLKLIQTKRLNTDFLISHKVLLSNILEGYKIFENKLNNCIKVAITSK